ncbi:hypothetical protein OB955_10785 [Halobacteria archaeon AArc-m2/3/4]|uniref:Uncharacterized protein n=1 Tax=Natronoglomus mannanivorans TaxID=2979990 RepID=A0ABT2QE68_9EURY|nr:hypothetical protein [Halobacteria archaeon AArc-m2/3/4]
MTPNSSGKRTRRWFLRGAAGTALVGTGVSGSTVLADDHSKSNDDRADATVSDAERMNAALICDVDMSMQFDNRMRLGGPSSDRDGAVHITSGGEQTRDYVCTTVDLRDADFQLGRLNQSGLLTYDYYTGEAHGHASPDEVFLILRQRRGQRESYHVAYRTLDEGAVGEWRTRDVSSELNEDGWRSVEVPADEIDVESELVQTTTEAIEERIASLAQQETFRNVVSRFGGNTEVLAASIGNGRLMEAVVSDVYYDNFQAGDDTKPIPAILHMSPNFEDGSVTLSLTDENVGVSLEDVDHDSVRLSRYAPIGLPITGTDVERESIAAQSVSVDGDQLRVQFDDSAVSSAVGESGTTMIYGAFDMDRPVTFIASGKRD